MAISNFQRFYGNMIWTDHAIDRLNKRHIPQADALKVMANPAKTFPGKKPGTVKFIRTINDRCIHLVGKLNDQKQWVVLTAWVRGEEDREDVVVRLVKFLLSWTGKIIVGSFKFGFRKIRGK